MTAAVRATALAAVALALFGCGSGDPSAPEERPPQAMAVTDAWAAEARGVAAVYLTISNPGPADRIVSVSATGAGSASVMGAAGLDAAAHAEADASGSQLAVPTGESVFAPGAGHVMLDGLSAPLRPGDEVRLELTFARAGQRTVTVDVLAWDEVIDRVEASPTRADDEQQGVTS